MLQLPLENIPKQEFRINLETSNYNYVINYLDNNLYVDVTNEGKVIFSGVRLTNNFIFTHYLFKGGLLLEKIGDVLGETIFLYYLNENELKDF